MAKRNKKICTACNIYKAVEGSKHCESCKGVLSLRNHWPIIVGVGSIGKISSFQDIWEGKNKKGLYHVFIPSEKTQQEFKNEYLNYPSLDSNIPTPENISKIWIDKSMVKEDFFNYDPFDRNK